MCERSSTSQSTPPTVGEGYEPPQSAGASGILKISVRQLHEIVCGSTTACFLLRGRTFSRAWVEGVLVNVDDGAAPSSFTLDDGTGTVPVSMPPEPLRSPVAVGDLVMVIGVPGISQEGGHSDRLAAHTIVLLNDQPQREALWMLELCEFWHDAAAG